MEPGLRRIVATVEASLDTLVEAFLASVTTGQQARRGNLAVTRQQATRRVAQGITLADFLQAFRIGQLTLWQGVLDAAGDDPEARAARRQRHPAG